MKKIAILILLLPCLLSGCFRMASPPPDSVVYENQKYKTGFYGDLYPDDLNFSGDEFEISGQEFQKVKSDKHNWIHSDIGEKSEGTIYCIETDWEKDKAFYSNPDNFNYYYCSGNDTPALIKKWNSVEYNRFDELTVFAEQHSYDPFNAEINKDQKKYPMPDWMNGEISFYKESKDGLFTSGPNTFHIINDKLVLLCYYDFAKGDEEKECMYGVAVPDNIARYFVDYIENCRK
jgi:hypothetical protein